MFRSAEFKNPNYDEQRKLIRYVSLKKFIILIGIDRIFDINRMKNDEAQHVAKEWNFYVVVL